LVIVFLINGIIAVATLTSVDVTEGVIGGLVAAVLAWLSYRAAVTSARLYGTILNTIADLVTDPVAEPSTTI
jgi:hypothetical protein